MLKDGIAYLLKFAPKEAYIDDLINGRLYMNAAGYYHGLPGEQGDPLEASMAPGVCLYGYTCLPIYCMYTVRENDIVDNAVKIPTRMIREFGCADGWIGSTTASRASPTDTPPTTEASRPTAPSPTASPGQN